MQQWGSAPAGLSCCPLLQGRMNHRDFKSPKKQRKGSAGGTGPPTSPVLGPTDDPLEGVGEVVGGNEALNELPQGPPGEAVTGTATVA